VKLMTQLKKSMKWLVPKDNYEWRQLAFQIIIIIILIWFLAIWYPAYDIDWAIKVQECCDCGIYGIPEYIE
jgi:hypothetical protein